MHDSTPEPDNAPAPSGQRAFFLILFGTIGILGCAALVVGTLAASAMVPDHDWIADTISDLAAGRWEIIMDVALYGFAAGLVATALAGAHAHLGGVLWSLGILALAILGGLVIIIGARNEYGDRDNSGVVVHMYLVYAMGALFPLVCALMQAGLRATGHRGSALTLVLLGVAWAILAPIFLGSATSVDGLIERVLGLIACGIACTLCAVFLRRARGAAEG